MASLLQGCCDRGSRASTKRDNASPLAWKRHTFAPMNDATTPVEQLIDSLTLGHPEVTVERLQVTHAADEDNVWYVRLEVVPVFVELEVAVPRLMPASR
jgi:hypothetical protein